MHPSLVLRVLLFASVCLPVTAQQLLETHTGSVGDEYGAALHQTADQNNDGYVDLLVGAPGWNSDRGYIRCLSGKFLATGTGSVVLWTLYSTANAGARFGSSIAEVATLTGNSATDYIVGAPGYLVGTSPRGAVMLVDGSTHVVANYLYGLSNTRLGEKVVAVGDQDGDGKVDFAATSPSTAGAASWVHMIPGSSFGVFNSLLQVPHSSINSNGSTLYGEELASGFDLDQDGRFDLAIGSPQMLTGGLVEVLRADSSWSVIATYGGSFASERMGSSIDARHDFNSDGVVDFVIGAPGYNTGFGFETGRAVVLSGLQMRNATAPFELYAEYPSSTLAVHFGACVSSSADLNNDGTADFIVGMPDYYSFPIPANAGKGGAVVFSGRTGVRLGSLVGLTQDKLGDALLGGFLDMNQDGFLDFAVAGSLSDNANVDCGTLKFYSLFPTTSTAYCTSKVNSLGCSPSTLGTGTPSVSSPSAFAVTCSNVINNKSGLMMYSHQPIATAFQGGYLCVNTPLRRTSPQNSGGSVTGSDCTGTFSVDFNGYMDLGLDPTLVAGAEIFCQFWSRDPLSASATNLSNALRFVINP